MSKKKKCKHWDVRLMRYQPLGRGAWTYPSPDWTEVSWDLATHKICFECKAQLAWGPSKDETDEKMGPSDDWGLGYALAVEQVAAGIMAGEQPLSLLHLDGWKDYWNNFPTSPILMSLTWHVGWLCAAIADDLRGDLDWTSSIDDLIQHRAGCTTCGTPMGGQCHLERWFHPLRISSALSATAIRLGNLEAQMRNVHAVLADNGDGEVQFEDQVLSALTIAESAIAPTARMVP